MEREAIELIEQHDPELILTDIMMPFISGLEVISHVPKQIKQANAHDCFSAAQGKKWSSKHLI